MNVLAVLWTVYLLGLCNCGELSSLRKEVVDLVFDLSFPDSSLVRYYESTADGVVYQSFFPKGQLFSKVVDGGATLWEAKGEERCSVLFTSVGNGKSRAILHVWANGIDSKMMHYEKLDGEWKLVTVRVKGRPVSDKPVSPQESLADLDFASLGCPLGGFSATEVPVEDPKPLAEEGPSHEEELGELDEASPGDTVEHDVKESEDVVGTPEESHDEEELTVYKVEDSPVEDLPELIKEVENEESTEPEPSVGDTDKAPKDAQPEVYTEVPQQRMVAPTAQLQQATEPAPPEEEQQQAKPQPAPLSEFAKKVDSLLFNVLDSFEGSAMVLKLDAKEGVTVKNLMYGKEEVWKDKKKSCSSALLYLDGEKPTLAVVDVQEKKNVKKIYRYHDGKKWKNGNIYDHNKKLSELKKKYKHAIPATLDLSNPDKTKLDVHTETESGMTVKEYSPKDAFHIYSVLDGGKELWKAGAGQKCFLVESYTKNTTKVIYLEIDNCNSNQSKYFGNNANGEWKSIEKVEFDKKIEEMIGESGNDTSLNIARINSSKCQSFDYTFAANAIKLLVPNKGVAVSKLMNGTRTVWTPGDNETFDHAKSFLNKDGKPELVLVVTTSSGTPKETYFELKGGKWVSCSNHDAKIKNLKDPVEWKSNFDIDVSASKYTDKCSIFEAELVGVTVKHLFSKPSHVIMKVKDGSTEVWKSRHCGAKDFRMNYDYCLSCLIYKKGDKELMEVTLVEDRSRGWKYFEKNGNSWTSIEKKEYGNKLQDLKNGVTTQPFVPSPKPKDVSEAPAAETVIKSSE
ncbi:hypothetical protein BEWA_001660 [Theileria equi strain WA]|uniref:Signal peptide containing protein n=1 Tax=Theileria equi strain WA TaxID=1537102 RepID=L0B0U4_THEEQ|nr:hypothetical protein BEWA_001660 [Theileria equi strain WA]AFZ80759.1 hypothetical protein BEWA_001660 [Theileria equi strain WA]|eukprot:XP_004830425.1 hypothetical protein BEWA_001660 [Theileria equi strain WA]